MLRWSGRVWRVWLLLLLWIFTIGGAGVLIEEKSGHLRVAKEARGHWSLPEVLRTPDVLFLQSIDATLEYIKKLLLGVRRSPRPLGRNLGWLSQANEEICETFGISEPPEILICRDPRMMALCSRSSLKKKSYVLLSSRILETLPPEEVIAVLAHELTHLAKGHRLKRGFLVLDFYRLMMLWSLKTRKSDDDLQTFAAGAGLWLLLGLQSRLHELEADRHMLDIVEPATALAALAHMHCPGDNPREVLARIDEFLKLLGKAKVNATRCYEILFVFSCKSTRTRKGQNLASWEVDRIVRISNPILLISSGSLTSGFGFAWRCS